MKDLRTCGVIFFVVGTLDLLLMFTRVFGWSVAASVFGRFLVCVGFLTAIGGLAMILGTMLRLPIALSVAQTAVTAILTFWADRMEWLRGDSRSLLPHFASLHYAVLDFRETWRSINAPTFPLNFFGSKAFHVLDLGMGEIPYIVAVAALWYLVGYFHERQAMRKRRFVSIAVLVWGVILLCLFVTMIQETAFEARSSISSGVPSAFPYGLWGLSLAANGTGEFDFRGGFALGTYKLHAKKESERLS